MSQSTINQRLQFLIEKLSVSARAFSEVIGEKPTNTQNYIGTRQIEPKREYLAKVLLHFSNVNPYWLLAGEGEPFKDGAPTFQTSTKISGKKNAVNVAGNNTGQATQNNYTITDCEKERDAYKAERDLAQKEVVLLRDQLAMKDALIAAKEEMLGLLRGSHNRPN